MLLTLLFVLIIILVIKFLFVNAPTLIFIAIANVEWNKCQCLISRINQFDMLLALV